MQWEAVTAIGTVAAVVLGAVWNDGRFKQWIKGLAVISADHTIQLKDHGEKIGELSTSTAVHAEVLKAHASRLASVEQWNIGFQAAAQVSNARRIVPTADERRDG